MTLPTRSLGFVFCGLTLMVVLAACGVPVDDQPERIDVPTLDSISLTTTSR